MVSGGWDGSFVLTLQVLSSYQIWPAPSTVWSQGPPSANRKLSVFNTANRPWRRWGGLRSGLESDFTSTNILNMWAPSWTSVYFWRHQHPIFAMEKQKEENIHASCTVEWVPIIHLPSYISIVEGVTHKTLLVWSMPPVLPTLMLLFIVFLEPLFPPTLAPVWRTFQ